MSFVQVSRRPIRWMIGQVGVFRISAAEFCGFEPANSFPLVGDNFGLPDKPYGHDAHRDDAGSNNKSLLCL